MEIEHTERGFALLRFVDRYGEPCTLQKSSLATEDAVWLGTAKDRMHLTVEQVADLLPWLRGFVATGELKRAASDWQSRALDAEAERDRLRRAVRAALRIALKRWEREDQRGMVAEIESAILDGLTPADLAALEGE